MDTDNYTIKFTAHAYKDLENIFEYISKNLYAPQAANRIMNMLDDSINSLSAQPFIAPFISDDFLAAKGLRKLVAEDYIVIYKVIKEACEIIIYRIVNGRTDYINLLK